MAEKGETSGEDIERGPHLSFNSDDSDASHCSSDAEEQSWHSPYDSNSAASPYAVFRASCASSSHETDVAPETLRNSCFSESSLEIDLESGAAEIKVNLAKVVEQDCRICHLGLQSVACESGVAIELGCSCKGDLASAHKQCAEKWFKIKGNMTCEICGSSAQNIAGAVDIQTEHIEEWNETSNNSNNTGTGAAAATENRRFWQGHRFLNFLLACMVFAFVISWLFHFNVPG